MATGDRRGSSVGSVVLVGMEVVTEPVEPMVVLKGSRELALELA